MKFILVVSRRIHEIKWHASTIKTTKNYKEFFIVHVKGVFLERLLQTSCISLVLQSYFCFVDHSASWKSCSSMSQLCSLSLSHDQGISMATGSSEVQVAEVGVWVGVSCSRGKWAWEDTLKMQKNTEKWSWIGLIQSLLTASLNPVTVLMNVTEM